MWSHVCASAVGTSHASAGLDCQDDCYSNQFVLDSGEACFVGIVADGAGSAQHGGHGAEIACETALRAILETLKVARISELQHFHAIEWIKRVQESINIEASKNGLCLRDYACTLLGGILVSDASVFFQIGDGAIVVQASSIWGVVFWPDSGEYANATYFVTDEEAEARLSFQSFGGAVKSLSIFSDGLQRLALSFEKKIPHIPFFEPMMSVLASRSENDCSVLEVPLKDFLNSTGVNERTDDDKSLVLAIRTNYE